MKAPKSVCDLSSTGRLFHTFGPATLKALSANVLHFVKGTARMFCCSRERSRYLAFYSSLMRSQRYLGAVPCKDLKTNVAILN